MTNSQLKSVQENIFSIREIAMTMLQSSDSNMIELAEILSDRVMDIEMELYDPEPGEVTNISEDDFRELLVEKEYEMLKENHPKQYELVSEEEQVEKWVDRMDKQDLQVEAKKLGYNII